MTLSLRNIIASNRSAANPNTRWHQPNLKGVMIPIASCVAYSLTSMSMTLLNKFILSQHKFEYPFLLLLWQNVFAVAFIYLAKGFNLLKLEGLEVPKAKKWLPINFFFIAMLVTHSLSLNRLSVPVVTVFKNLTTVGVALGDCLMLGHEITSMMFMSAILMFSGSLVAGWTDLEFDLLGYEWMLCNCVASAAYLLYLKHTIKQVQLTEFGMVLYNNALSIPIALVWSCYYEGPKVVEAGYVVTSSFVIAMVYGGVNGLLVSLTSLWCVKATSPTTYSMVGAINKVPLTIIAVTMFNNQLSFLGQISICVGLLGGILYTWAKAQQSSNINAPKELPPTIPEHEKVQGCPSVTVVK